MSNVPAYFTRHSTLLPEGIRQRRINIIGAGAVGGWTALALAKMGFTNLVVWDGDTVGEENVGVQLYGPAHIGQPKPVALASLIKELSSISIVPKSELYTGQPLSGIVVAAVDSMEGRKAIWEAAKRDINTVEMFIDPRMGAEQAMLFVMSPSLAQDKKTYTGSLYTDDQAQQERCTERATSYTAMMLGGTVAKAVKDTLCAANYSRIMRWNIKDNTMEVQDVETARSSSASR
jgi:hypothetical protein